MIFGIIFEKFDHGHISLRCLCACPYFYQLSLTWFKVILVWLSISVAQLFRCAIGLEYVAKISIIILDDIAVALGGRGQFIDKDLLMILISIL